MICGRQDKVRTANIWSTPQLCTFQPESWVACCEGGLGAGKWGLEHGPREDTAVSCEKIA